MTKSKRKPKRKAGQATEQTAQVESPAGYDARLVKIATFCLAALLCFFIASQYYRTMPMNNINGRDFIEHDKLIFPDIFLDLRNGGATHSEQITNPAPYFTTFYPIVGLAILAGGDWRLSLATYSVVMAMALLFSLACLVRLATRFAIHECVLAAVVATTFSAVLIRHGGFVVDSFDDEERLSNIIMFLLAACAMVKVVASPRINHPLLWAYLPVCFVFGISDALFLFHVAMPVFIVALMWWLVSPGSAKRASILASATAGCLLVVAGKLTLPHVNPFLPNQFGGAWLEYRIDDYQRMLEYFHAHGLMATASDFKGFFVTNLTQALEDLVLGVNWPRNTLLAASGLALAPWLFKGALSRKVAAGEGVDTQHLVLPTLAQLVLALFVSCILMFALVRFTQEYAFAMLWIPFLPLVVVWAHVHSKILGGQKHDRQGVAGPCPVLHGVGGGCAVGRPGPLSAQRLRCPSHRMP